MTSAPRASLAGAALLLAAATGLSGCGETRQAFGLDRTVPDEFAVVPRAPLSMPPDFNLRPPAPGAPRPQEMAARERARQVVTGQAEGSAEAVDPLTEGESALLARAGADEIEPDIRRVVNEESAALLEADDSFVDRLMFWQNQAPPGTVVDPRAEAQRLATSAAMGEPLSAGEVPTIERRSREPLEGIFDGLFN
jgi:hypothetical protein